MLKVGPQQYLHVTRTMNGACTYLGIRVMGISHSSLSSLVKKCSDLVLSVEVGVEWPMQAQPHVMDAPSISDITKGENTGFKLLVYCTAHIERCNK